MLTQMLLQGTWPHEHWIKYFQTCKKNFIVFFSSFFLIFTQKKNKTKLSDALRNKRFLKKQIDQFYQPMDISPDLK